MHMAHTPDLETILRNQDSFFSGASFRADGITVNPLALIGNKRIKIVAESASAISGATAKTEDASGGLAIVESESVNLETGEIVRVISIPEVIAEQVINTVAMSAAGAGSLASGSLPPGIRKQLLNAGANAALIARAEALAALGFPPGLIKQVALLCLSDNAAAITSLNRFETERNGGLSFGDAKNVTLAAGCVVPGTPPPPGLLHWFPGDGNAIDIIGANNGTLKNGATFASGKVLQAFSLDGVDDFVDIPHTASLNVSPAFSVDFWVNANAVQVNPDGLATVIDKTHRSSELPPFNSGWVFQAALTGPVAGELTLNIGNGTTFSPGARTLVNIFDGVFHHIAGVFNGTTIRMYLDGVLVHTVPFAGTPLGNTSPLNFGRFAIQNKRHFKGLLDEVEIFNRALTGPEILAIFNAGSLGKQKP